MPQVYLIGIGLGNPDTLMVRAKRLIEQSDCLIGAKRMLESAANDHAARHSTIKNEEIAAIIASQPENSIVSVLLSGDVGFYSAAKKLTALLSCPPLDSSCSRWPARGASPPPPGSLLSRG